LCRQITLNLWRRNSDKSCIATKFWLSLGAVVSILVFSCDRISEEVENAGNLGGGLGGLIRAAQRDLTELQVAVEIAGRANPSILGRRGAAGEVDATLLEGIRELPEYADRNWPRKDLVDPWGQAYHYQWWRGAHIRVRVWSSGPNKLDESGQNDDIVRDSR